VTPPLTLTLVFFFVKYDCIKKPAKSSEKAATKSPIVPLGGGNSMNAKKGYSSHPLRGYEGDGDRGTERNYMALESSEAGY
jgi:hypothetical protein